jgi:methionyl-tRNA synthetase
MAEAMGSPTWPGSAEAALSALIPSVPDVLFAKIQDEERADWATRFAGVRT